MPELSLYQINSTKANLAHTHAGTDITSIVTNASYADNVQFSGILSKPTTLSGYGITDAALITHNHNTAYSALAHTHAGIDITSTVANATNATNVPFSGIISKPTTLLGYGIIDAAASVHTHTKANITDFAHAHAGTEITGTVANANYATSAGSCSGNSETATSANYANNAGSCTGNSATATYATSANHANSAASCSGNSETATSANYATSAGSCSGNSATATSANYANSAGNADTVDGYHISDIQSIANNAFDAGHSFAENGWQKLNNGLILQWVYTPGDHIIDILFPFPIQFPNKVLSFASAFLNISDLDSISENPAITFFNTSGFKVSDLSGFGVQDSNVRFSWIIIGY